MIVLDIEAEEEIVPLSTNPVPLHLKRDVNAPVKPRRNPTRKRRGRNWRYEDPDTYSSDEDMQPFDVRSPTSQQESVKIAANPPTYCFLHRPPPHLRPPIMKKGFKKFPE